MIFLKIYVHKILFSIFIGMYKVGPNRLIESLYIEFICLLSACFEDTIYYNIWKEVFHYKVWL